MSDLIFAFIIGVAIALNAVIILHRIKHKRYLNAGIDCCLMALVFTVCTGSTAAMASGMVGGMLISTYISCFGILKPKVKEN